MEGCIVVLLGPPGSGKGTQGKLLQDMFSWPQISTGDILRDMSKSDTPLGSHIREVQASGNLVSDQVLAQVVRNRTSKSDCKEGFILDGYPRTIKQAQDLEQLAREKSKAIRVVAVDVEEVVLFNRLTGRRSCTNCREIYNVYLKPPIREGYCDKCGSALMQREDDKPEVIKNRLEAYRKNTSPLLDYFGSDIIVVDGQNPPEQVFEDIVKQLEEVVAGDNH
jgi:adenylate kinase